MPVDSIDRSLSAPLSRRRVLRTGAWAATAASVLPVRSAFAISSFRTRSAIARANARQAVVAELVAPEIMERLVLTALDAAKTAGALYAAAQITRTVSQFIIAGTNLYRDNHGNTEEDFDGKGDGDVEQFGLSVRALMPGGWGFAATPYWRPDDAARVGREAVAQAAVNGRVLRREIDIGQVPVAKGTWTPPGVIDPFAIGVDEKLDHFNAWNARVPDHGWRSREKGVIFGAGASGEFTRREQVVATTEGALFSQVLYQSKGNFGVSFNPIYGVDNFTPAVKPPVYVALATLPGLDLQEGGWEIFQKARPVESIPRLVEQAMKLAERPSERAVDIGRYTVVFDAATMGSIIEKMIGHTTQLDRVLGLEANANGTSYLGPDPLERLGSYTYKCPQLQITANRSQPGGLATVKWDDEGVEPEDTVLIKDGILVDYQTTRDQAQLLAPYYQKQGRAVRSHGYAASTDALRYPLQMLPNLIMRPGPEAVTFDNLIASTGKGIAITGASVQVDFQGRNGAIEGGVAREIVNGRLGAVMKNGGALVDVENLWKGMIALGGAESAQTMAVKSEKGEPSQFTWSSLTAVPAVFKDVAIIDSRKKA